MCEGGSIGIAVSCDGADGRERWGVIGGGGLFEGNWMLLLCVALDVSNHEVGVTHLKVTLE